MIDEATAEAAARLLGVNHLNTNPAEVRAAFWSAAKSAHPDKGGAPDAFSRITKAKDDLLAWLQQRTTISQACSECGGTGTISKMRGWKVLNAVCRKCHGSGYT